MVQTWEAVPSNYNPLLDPRRRITEYTVDDLDEWARCPIDNMPNNGCFHLPGVTDGGSQASAE